MLQALAIKYRPKTFDELIGQETVSKSLKFALSHERLAHAYLFSGLRGSGKTSSARIFSRCLVCDSGPTPTPCGTCPQCEAALGGKHIDIIEMDAASHRGLDEIQDLIEQTKYAPSMARFKIFIIDEVHMLTPQAANALLKTLEEPPAYVKFILATTDPLKLPATVLSRTQHFRFKQIAQSAILSHLEWILNEEGVKFEKDALKLLARSGGGSLRDTLTLLDQAIIYSQNEITPSKIALMLGFLDPEKIKEFYSLILAKNKDAVLEFLKELQDYEASSVIDEMIFYLKESFFAKNNEFSMLIYERFFRILSRAKTMLQTSDDNAFVLCVMSFMMIEASNLKQIDDVIAEISHSTKPNVAANAVNLGVNMTKETPKGPYERLCEAIFKRDHTLGEVFEQNTSFVEFDGKVLKITSNADTDAARKALNSGFKLIQNLAKQSLGDSVKIEVSKALKVDESKLNDIKKLGGNAGNSSVAENSSSPVSQSENLVSAENSSLTENAGNSGSQNENFVENLSSKNEANLVENSAENAKNSSSAENLALNSNSNENSKAQNSAKNSSKKSLKESFEELKKGAKKADPQSEAKAALDEVFGKPSEL